jgi:hypothetical protein
MAGMEAAFSVLLYGPLVALAGLLFCNLLDAVLDIKIDGLLDRALGPIAGACGIFLVAWLCLVLLLSVLRGVALLFTA